MTAASLATRQHETPTQSRQAPSLRLVSAHDEFEEIETCEEMIRRWRHDRIAKKMSRHGKRLAAAPSSLAPIGTPLDEMTEIYVILALGIGLGLVFASPAERVINSIASTISPPQVQIAADRAPEAATGAATIAFDRASGKIIVPVEINGVRARLHMDTGSAATFLTAEMAKRAGLVAEGATYESRGLGGGGIKVKPARATLFRVGGISIKDMPLWVEETPKTTFLDSNQDGLLGLDFLQKFDMHISNGVLELKPLGAK
jgi:predicted aspartyl protease